MASTAGALDAAFEMAGKAAATEATAVNTTETETAAAKAGEQKAGEQKAAAKAAEEEAAAAEAAEEEAAEEEASEQLSIALIDDDILQLRLLGAQFSRLGATVTTFTSGTEFLSAPHKQWYQKGPDACIA